MPSGQRAYAHPHLPELSRNITVETFTPEYMGFSQLPTKLVGFWTPSTLPMLGLAWQPSPGQPEGDSNSGTDTELEGEPGSLCQGEYPRLSQAVPAPITAHSTAWGRGGRAGRATPYLRRSQNMSMISKSDWTHRSREKSSN